MHSPVTGRGCQSFFGRMEKQWVHPFDKATANRAVVTKNCPLMETTLAHSIVTTIIAQSRALSSIAMKAVSFTLWSQFSNGLFLPRSIPAITAAYVYVRTTCSTTATSNYRNSEDASAIRICWLRLGCIALLLN